MTPIRRSTLTALVVSATMTASCAASRPTSTAAPPRLELPDAAGKPCALAVLPSAATQADLEAAYAERGAQVVTCDAARRLAVEVLLAERALIDRWLVGAKR